MKNRIAIIDGLRTPMAKAGGELKNIEADDLGTHVVKSLINNTGVDVNMIDEVIIGNVAQPPHAANVSRVIALKAGIPVSVPAYTVHRNCASGMEALTSAYYKIVNNEANIIIAGGTESMSNIPLFFNKPMVDFFSRLSRSRSVFQKLKTISGFKLSYLKPEIGLLQGLTDPVSGLIMGKTAEVLAREFSITREEQDEFALLSHQRAVKAIENGIFGEEIIPIGIGPDYSNIMEHDSGPRKNQSLKALGKLKPYFEKKNGTVTVGNACPITDGAAALLLMSEKKAKELGYEPLGYLKDFAYAGLEPERMGLGPAYATAKLFSKSKLAMKDIELVELNEAFAAQVIANERAFDSTEFAKKFLSRDKALGELNRDILNVNGGAIALGHPVGMTGSRLVLHLLKELRRRDKNTGLATLCIGGGQGAALLLEVR